MPLVICYNTNTRAAANDQMAIRWSNLLYANASSEAYPGKSEMSMSETPVVVVRDLKVQRFGEKLRVLRTRRGMNLVELAYALGYAGSGHVSQIETGGRGPTVDLVLKVSRLFHISADVLLDDMQELEP